MRAVLQRVTSASVTVDGQLVSQIEVGFLVLLGIGVEDGEADASWLARKIVSMRVFSDEAGMMNLDLAAVRGELLVVSQFTLLADCRKGNRPSFIAAARPEQAVPLYEFFLAELSRLTGRPPKAGIFGADMKIALVNDGPVTIVIDTAGV